MRQVDGWWSHSLGHKGHIAPGGAAHGMQDGLRSSIYHIQPTTRKIFILPVPKFSWFFPTVQNGWNQRRNLHRPTRPSIDRWARVSRYESPPPLDVIQYQEGDPIWGDIPQSHQLGELLLYLKSKLGWWELLWQCAALSFSLGSPQKRGARPAILCPWSHRSGQNRVCVPSPISEVMATEKKAWTWSGTRMGRFAHGRRGSVFWSQSHLIRSAQPRDLRSEILRPPVQEAGALCPKLQGNLLLVHPCALSKETMISILTCIRAKKSMI